MADKLPLPEAPGVAWVDIYTKNGDKIGLTSRDISPIDALVNLMGAVEFGRKEYGLMLRGDMNDPYEVADITPAQDLPEFDDFLVPSDTPVSTAKPLPAQPSTGGFNWGLVDYAPKKADAGPGDTFEVQVAEYEVKDGKIMFYKAGAQYPEIDHNLNTAVGADVFGELFKGWQPDQSPGKHPIPGGMIVLGVTCSQKLTRAGNPYYNLTSVRR